MAQIDMTDVVSPIVNKMEETIDKLDDASARLDSSIKSVKENVGEVRGIQEKTQKTQDQMKKLSEEEILPEIQDLSKKLAGFNTEVQNANSSIRKNTDDLTANWEALQKARSKEEKERNERWEKMQRDSEHQSTMGLAGIVVGVIGLGTGILAAAYSSQEQEKATEAIRVLNNELNESKQKMNREMGSQLAAYNQYTQDLSTTFHTTIEHVHQLNSELNERKEKDIQLKEDIEQLPSYIVKGTAASCAIIIIASCFLNRYHRG